MILAIDTSNNLQTIVGLGTNELIKQYNHPREQELILIINTIMTKNSIRFNQIEEIKVNIGPGSFTGIRVGVSVANALAWCLDIKVNKHRLVLPKYQNNLTSK